MGFCFKLLGPLPSFVFKPEDVGGNRQEWQATHNANYQVNRVYVHFRSLELVDPAKKGLIKVR